MWLEVYFKGDTFQIECPDYYTSYGEPKVNEIDAWLEEHGYDGADFLVITPPETDN